MRGTAVAAVSAAFLLWACIAGGAEEASQVESPSATVTAQRGTTEALQLGAEEWILTQVGAIYASGTALRTGQRAYLDVSFDEDNSFRIKGNTQVRVEKIFETAEGDGGKVIRLIEVQVIDGEVNARLNRLPSDVRVEVVSPTAVAGATGTGFSFAYNQTAKHVLVRVAQSQVRVSALDRSDKTVMAKALEQVEVQAWKGGRITATGRGVLSERILGKAFVDKFRQQAKDALVSAQASAPAPGDAADQAAARAQAQAAALDAARAALTAVIMSLPVDETKTVADLLVGDTAAAAKVYELVNGAEAARTSYAEDGTCTVVVEVGLEALGKALGRDLLATIASVRELSKDDYLATFGAQALETTKRAAQVDAQRRLAAKLNGSIIGRGRTLRDEIDQNARVRTTVLGVVEGAIIKEEHYYSDGSIMLVMSCDLSEIAENHPDIVGRTYLSSPEPVVFTDFEDYRVMRTRLLSAVAPGGRGGGGTQGAMAKKIVQMLGLEGEMGSDATEADYAALLAGLGFSPLRGWALDQPMSDEDLAVLMVLLLGLGREVGNPADPDDFKRVLREHDLVLSNLRDLLGNINLPNGLVPIVHTSQFDTLYSGNLSPTTGF
jgi:hypothetical protein